MVGLSLFVFSISTSNVEINDTNRYVVFVKMARFQKKPDTVWEGRLSIYLQMSNNWISQPNYNDKITK